MRKYGIDIEASVPMPPGSYIEKTSDYTGTVDAAGRKVWKHRSKKQPFYLVWDGMHGEIEVFYIKTLKHRAVYFPNGEYKSGPVEGRKLEFR